MSNSLYPETAAEMIERWDAGHSVWTVEMGGLGPGYEQAIQVLAIEIMRDLLKLEEPVTVDTKPEIIKSVRDHVIRERFAQDENGEPRGYGFSGAQVGAATNLAWRFVAAGPAQGLSEVEKDRRIQVSRDVVPAPHHEREGGE